MLLFGRKIEIMQIMISLQVHKAARLNKSWNQVSFLVRSDSSCKGSPGQHKDLAPDGPTTPNSRKFY